MTSTYFASSDTNAFRSWKPLVFRLGAVSVGLGALLLVEIGLRFSNWGPPADTGDPFVGFSEVKPLFVLNDGGDRYEIPRSRQIFFQPESFAAQKSPNEFRIYCLGGSTVQGRPYSIETSFTTWLELSLKAADASRAWEVVNCGGVSYASYRLVPIVKEVLAYEPDMFIIYTGHNEFLEDRTYGHVKRTPAWLKRLHEPLIDLRIYGVCQRLWFAGVGDHSKQSLPVPETLSTDVEALLDYQGGLEKYRRDDQWRRDVIEHFEHNLRRMIRIARIADVPVVLVNPVSNLKDSPPFKTQHDDDLTPEQVNDFQRLWDAAKQTHWKQVAKKVALLERALAIDDRHADAHFLLATCYHQMGLFQQAKAEYVRAKDEDVCPLRILEPMHEVIFRVARQLKVPLIDVRALFESQSKDGIPGDLLLVDHVHPWIDGHQLIAGAILAEMQRQKIVAPITGWEVERDRLYADRFKSLADNYFPESAERLDGLRRWTQGRVDRVGAPTKGDRGTATQE